MCIVSLNDLIFGKSLGSKFLRRVFNSIIFRVHSDEIAQ